MILVAHSCFPARTCVIERNSHPALVHFALSIGGFAIGTTEFATMSLLRYFAHDLRIDEPTAGHVISAYALGVVIGAPIIAVLSARLPRRTVEEQKCLGSCPAQITAEPSGLQASCEPSSRRPKNRGNSRKLAPSAARERLAVGSEN